MQGIEKLADAVLARNKPVAWSNPGVSEVLCGSDGRSQVGSAWSATAHTRRHATKPMEATGSARSASSATSNGFHSGAKP
jgi:hypothetical protein